MRSRTCLRNWLGALSPSISPELSQGFWVCGSWDTGNKKHAQCFPFRFITLMSHVSSSWGGGVNSYRAEKGRKKKKNALTETYPSSGCWHLHLNLLFLKDVEGESSSLCMSLHTGECKCVICLCSKNPSLWYFQFKRGPNISCYLKN